MARALSWRALLLLNARSNSVKAYPPGTSWWGSCLFNRLQVEMGPRSVTHTEELLATNAAQEAGGQKYDRCPRPPRHSCKQAGGFGVGRSESRRGLYRLRAQERVEHIRTKVHANMSSPKLLVAFNWASLLAGLLCYSLRRVATCRGTHLPLHFPRDCARDAQGEANVAPPRTISICQLISIRNLDCWLLFALLVGAPWPLSPWPLASAFPKHQEPGALRE